MADTIIYSSCPSCSSKTISKTLVCKDYTVSGELFEIWHCDNCSLRFTQNIPDVNSIGAYYQSADYVSHSDTKQGFINRLYHLIRTYTLKTKRNLVQKATYKTRGSLLDVGAGTGSFAHTMKMAGWSVTGLEPDETARANAAVNYNIELSSPETLTRIPAESVDAITLWHVLEHVHELHDYLERFHSMLKSDGRLIIAVPNYTSWDAVKYAQHWAAYDVPRHLYHFSPASLKVLLQAKGFALVSTSGMWFDSFYVSMLSEKYRHGKGNIIRAFWNGLVSNVKALSNKERCSSLVYIIRKNHS